MTTIRSALNMLLARKLAVAFAVGFLGVFLPSVLNVLDKVAAGSPSALSKSAVVALIAGAVAAGVRAVLALSPINVVPSDAAHSLIGRKPAAAMQTGLFIASPSTGTNSEVTFKLGPSISVHLIPETDRIRRRLGRHVEHDARSRLFQVADNKPPTTAILWDRHGKPFNQGDLGSCTGNALAGILNTDPFRARRRGRLLTEKDAVQLYELATTLDGVSGQYPPDDTGSSGLAVCKAAVKLGYIGGYRHALSLGQALAALRTGPVITGVNWYDGFDQPDPNGVVEISGSVRGGHEFEVIGYDPATDLVTAVNSWGTSWGDRGRFRFTSATWGRLLAERGDVTVPTVGAVTA